jgi:hypothetical protein
MGFAPTPEQYKAYEYASWHEYGKKAVPASGGSRDTFWTNVNRGQEILRRIKAVGGGVDDGDELRQKELEQSPEYIAKQAKIKADKIQAELDREKAIYQAGIVEGERLLEIQLENQRLQEIENQMITFNEQQNSGDFNDTPITEINPMDSCSGCGVDIHSLKREQQLNENYLKIGGIAAVGIGILLLYTRSNKK